MIADETSIKQIDEIVRAHDLGSKYHSSISNCIWGWVLFQISIPGEKIKNKNKYPYTY